MYMLFYSSNDCFINIFNNILYTFVSTLIAMSTEAHMQKMDLHFGEPIVYITMH